MQKLKQLFRCDSGGLEKGQLTRQKKNLMAHCALLPGLSSNQLTALLQCSPSLRGSARNSSGTTQLYTMPLDDTKIM